MAKKKNKKKRSFKLERRPSYKTIYEQIRKIAPLVAHILKREFKTRDDDNILYIEVWKHQGMTEKDSIKNFKYKLIMGKYYSPESIARCRRRLQEKNKSLRGSLYKERHDAEKEMLNQMSFSFNI